MTTITPDPVELIDPEPEARSSEPYQVLPPLTDPERDALRQSIATFGVLQPVITDEGGAVIDGHHRAAIATGLGIPYPTVILPGLTHEQKLEQALALNLGRRHLTPGCTRQSPEC